jgi:ribosomal-protein-alanine N-acetyltransferase
MTQEEKSKSQVMEFPTLLTKRLMLREFRDSDAGSVFDIFSREEVTRYYNISPLQSVGRAEKLVKARANLYKDGVGVRWALVLKNQRDWVIGSCGYYYLKKGFRSAEIGFDLHPDYWRQGIMTEALTAMIDYGYSDRFFFRLNRIEALTELENKASIRLLKKLGFTEEGIRREYGYWKDTFHDLRSFSLLRRDWVN